MVNPWFTKLSKVTGKTESEIEKYWENAKVAVAKKSGVKQDEWTSAHYCQVYEIVKKEAGLKEYVPDFVQSKMSAREFIETVISGQFNAINKDGLIASSDAHRKKPTKLVPALGNMEHSDEKDPAEGKELDFDDLGGTAGDSQAGDGGVGESVEDSTDRTIEEDDDTDYNFDFLNEVEERE